ncbi:flagellin [Exiguobacterium sp. AT1b]|uniref:flagellin N-terminal helical domain-containing protein n=1 Tax=Exiguobacterium sp. (strain ATCC BAA-1283 / AT1b) TaxID=360911 RepID=UPI00093B50CA|nr:flagellin [Exiguobacterium sp. AT1b]
MIINHNLNSMNAHRNMGFNTAQTGKAMEKLSSGLRINRAGDDAAGLAISEKMRGQIRGLDQATRNSQDGISMIQTAEGALNETHSILQRMRELSVQSSNDTNTDADRMEIQKEIEQMTKEIDRIGQTTEFNTKKLLQGDGGVLLDKTSLIATATSNGSTNKTNATQTLGALAFAAADDGKSVEVTLNGEKLTINLTQDTTNVTAGQAVVDVSSATSNSININFNGTVVVADADDAIKSALEEMIKKNDVLSGNVTVTNTGTAGEVKIDMTGDFAGAEGNIATATETLAATVSGTTASVGTTTKSAATSTIDLTSAFSGKTGADLTNAVKDLVGKGFEVNGQSIEFYDVNEGPYKGDGVGVDISRALDPSVTSPDAAEAAVVTSIVNQIGEKLEGVKFSSTTAGQLTATTTEVGVDAKLNIVDGATKKDFSVKFQVGANESQNLSVTISDMRAEALGVAKLDVTNQENASKAISTLDKAIETVSAQRSNLGAVQNRLEHTINNLSTSAENLQAAESRIRDVDMAKEMMNFTKNNILNQAAQAMMSQSNQQPQAVLQLLR